MNEGTILSRSFFFDRSTRERIFSFKRKKERKKMYFQKLGNDGSNEDDLYRVEIWKDRSKHGEIRIGDLDTIIGTRRSMNKYVRYKRWLRRVEKHALRFRNLIETRYFDRGSGWKLIESRKRWNYFSLPLPRTMKRKKSNRSVLFVAYRTRSIEFEAYRAKCT